MFCAAPHTAEPRANMAMKTSKTGLRPNIETIPPTRGRAAVAPIEYALPTHMKSVPFKLCTMVGRAVETAVYVAS